MSDATTHRVVDGESVESIAANCGLNTNDIWNLSENKALRDLRKDPDILSPGDKLAVPATKPLEFRRPTGQTHDLVVTVPKSKLRLQLKLRGQPRANLPCLLFVDGQQIPLTTDGEGKLETTISAKAKKARLVVDPKGKQPVTYQLLLRGIHPTSVATGWQGRLHNLGYPVDVDGEATGAMSQAALSLFQEKQKLTPNGTADDDTKAKLEELHGC